MKWFSCCILIIIINPSALKTADTHRLHKYPETNVKPLPQQLFHNRITIRNIFIESNFKCQADSCQANENDILIGETMLWIILLTRKF